MYEVSDNRIALDEYFFEMDTRYNIHVYEKGMKYFDMIENTSKLNFDEFKYKCNQWLVENR